MKRVFPELIKSQSDSRIYKFVELPNQMRCLLISDPETEKSATSLDVNVGSALDGKQWQGVAHFLEHMLFMGTQKYPNENEYSSYLQKFGGTSNAWTSNMSTNYQFEVGNQGFHGALDRFAQFFISPLISASSSEREILAVESEYQQSFQNDSRILYRLHCQMGYRNSYWNHFGTGNLQTLKVEGVREQMLNFHSKWYSANLMTLCVLNNSSIEQLEKQISELFSQVVNKNVSKIDMSQPVPFDINNTSKLIKFVPVKDKDQLTVIWSLDYIQDNFQCQPLRYISALFGHEGKNSLLSYLIEQDLAVTLTSSDSHDYDSISMFQVQIQLTKKGMAQVDQVLQAIFDYAKMIAKSSPQQYFFEELKKTGVMKMKFAQKQQPFNYVTSLSNSIQHFREPSDLQYLIQHMYFAEQFDSPLIQKYLDSVATGGLVNIFLSSKEFEGKLEAKSEVMGTQYQVLDYKEKIHKMRQDIFQNQKIGLPVKNILIPENFEILKSSGEKCPQKLYQTETCSLYHLQDCTFNLPQTYYNVQLTTRDNNITNSVRGVVYKSLWVKVVNEYLREYLYMGGLAEMVGDVGATTDGINFYFQGFTDKIQVFIQEMLKIIKNVQKNDNLEDVFNQAKSVQLKNYKNIMLEQSHMLSRVFLERIQMEHSYEKSDLSQYLETYQFSDFISDLSNWLKSGRMQIFSYGNLSSSQSLEITQSVIYELQIKASNLSGVRLVNLQGHFVYDRMLVDSNNQNSCVMTYFQTGQYGLKESVINRLIMHFLKEPCFNYLRTKQQLGYIVHSFPGNNRLILNSTIIVQSQKYSSEYIINHINIFLSNIETQLMQLSQSDYEQLKQSVLVELQKKDINMKSVFSRQLYEVNNYQYIFDRQQRQCDILAATTLEELQAYFKQVYVENKKRVDIQVNSAKHLVQLKSINILLLILIIF